jgi:hypothetical protein
VSDRECGGCVAPEVTLADNADECIIPVFQMDGDVVMEAEHFHAQVTNGSDHAWALTAAPLASGGECMDVNPDVDYSWTAPVGYAPRLDFRVEFTATGTYFLHLRGDAGSTGGASDTCFAGLDNNLGPTYDFDDQGFVWGWRTQTITVNSVGIHIVNVWAREDGFCLDKLVVSTSGMPPTGEGPAESPQQ